MAFFAVFDRVSPNLNKYMATLFNTSATRKVVVNRIYRFDWQVAAATGVQLEQELRGITARSGGNAVTIVSEDPNDSLSAGITAEHGSTGVTEGGHGLVRRLFATSEEVALAASIMPPFVLGHDSDAQLVYQRGPNSSGLVLRENDGLTIKNLTNSNVGTVSYVFEFEDQPA